VKFLGVFQLVLIVVVLASVGVIYRGLFEHRRRKAMIRQVLAETALVSLADITSLSQEAIRLFRDQFGITIRYDDDFELLANTFDDAVRSRATVAAFASPQFPFYAFLTIGAAIGELLRFRCGGRWAEATEFGPRLTELGTAVGDVHPLHMALMHHLKGKPGDLAAEMLRLYSLRSGNSIFGSTA